MESRNNATRVQFNRLVVSEICRAVLARDERDGADGIVGFRILGIEPQRQLGKFLNFPIVMFIKGGRGPADEWRGIFGRNLDRRVEISDGGVDVQLPMRRAAARNERALTIGVTQVGPVENRSAGRNGGGFVSAEYRDGAIFPIDRRSRKRD